MVWFRKDGRGGADEAAASSLLLRFCSFHQVCLCVFGLACSCNLRQALAVRDFRTRRLRTVVLAHATKLAGSSTR